MWSFFIPPRAHSAASWVALGPGQEPVGPVHPSLDDAVHWSIGLESEGSAKGDWSAPRAKP